MRLELTRSFDTTLGEWNASNYVLTEHYLWRSSTTFYWVNIKKNGFHVPPSVVTCWGFDFSYICHRAINQTSNSIWLRCRFSLLFPFAVSIELLYSSHNGPNYVFATTEPSNCQFSVPWTRPNLILPSEKSTIAVWNYCNIRHQWFFALIAYSPRHGQYTSPQSYESHVEPLYWWHKSHTYNHSFTPYENKKTLTSGFMQLCAWAIDSNAPEG